MSDKALAPAGLQHELARQLLRDKRIRGAYPPDTWLEFLPAVGEADRQGDRRRGGAGTAAVICGVATFISLFITIHFPPLLAASGAGLLATIFFALRWRSLEKEDLANFLPGFVVPLVRVLREEMAAGEPLHLALDLRGGLVRDKQDRMRRGAGQSFADPWLSGGARLLDGSVVGFKVVDHLLKLTRSKRSASGKTKIKTVLRLRRLIEVALKVRSKDYQATPGAERGVKSKAGERHQVVRVRRVLKHKTTPGSYEADVPGVQDLLAVMAQAFAQVAPAGKKEAHP